MQFFDPHTTEGKIKVIIKKARRVKNDVGKRSKSRQLNTEPKEKAFLIYASFTIKKMRVDFCFDTHSAGKINLDHKYIARLNKVK